MKRHQCYILTFVILALVWAGLKYNQSNLSSPQHRWLVDVSPWLLLMWLGCYCLGKLGLDLLLFNDYPQEIKVLEEDIKQARSDLAKRGFVDPK